MASFIDVKYINLVSPLLKKFKWKTPTLANMRCPICGDSQKHKNKARGYFFKKNNDFFFKCHNCGAGLNLYNFLETMSPYLCKQYAIERYVNGDSKRGNYKKPSLDTLYPEKATPVKSYSYVSIDSLPEDHECVKYLNSRNLTKTYWKHFRYAEDFSVLAKEINERYNVFREPRLIIPILDRNSNVVGIQGRSLSESCQASKYITLRVDETNICFGLNNIKTNEEIMLVEGPIDSLFLPNTLACLGSSNFLDFENKFNLSNVIHILDNEPRNKEILKIMKALIDSNKKICIWPKDIKHKDINEMVLCDLDVCAMIRQHVYQGLSAQVEYNEWKK